jgi:predicted GNAT family acetyltransferase
MVTVTDRSRSGQERTRNAEIAGPAYHAAMTESAPVAADLLVEDNPEESRYEAWLGDRMVGIAEYELPDESGPIVFVHTEVLPGAEGMGVGRGLARAALDDVRRRGLRLVAECEFIAGFLKRHPEDRDLLAD